MGKRGEGWFVLQLGLFAVILLAPRVSFFPFPTWLRALGVPILVAGAALGTAGILALGRSLSPFPKPLEGGQMVSTGVYGFVRHPIYAGLILGTIGWGLLAQTWLGVVLAAILFVFFDLKSRREEAWLVEKYPDYVEYRRRVKKLIPLVY